MPKNKHKPLVHANNKRLMKLLTESIACEIESVTQWHRAPFIEEFMSTCANYVSRLTALVELLEVYDCGSIGGFGKGQDGLTSHIAKRAIWLLKKYGAPENVKRAIIALHAIDLDDYDYGIDN